jgi:hypothetical protein
VVLTPEFSDGDNGLGRCNKLLPPNQIRVRRVLLIEEVSANDRYATNRASGHKVTVIIWKFRITVCDGNKGIPRDRVTQCPGKAWKPRWHSMIRYNCSAMFSEMWTVCTEYNSYWANFKPLSAKSREQAHWPKSAKDIAFEESLQGRFRTRRGISIASFPLSISLWRVYCKRWIGATMDEFINPPSVSTGTQLIWALGSSQYLNWTTTYSGYSLYLYNSTGIIAATLLRMCYIENNTPVSYMEPNQCF